MCDRYVIPDSVSIEQEFDLVRPDWEFPTNFNAAPAQSVPCIRVVDGQPDPLLLRWGLEDQGTHKVPASTLQSAGGLGSPWMQRCIVPALGFYEWRTDAGGNKRPFYVHIEDQPVFGVAGLWERESCIIVTVPANEMMVGIDRSEWHMPAILARDIREVWLYGSAANASAALAAYPSDGMVAYQVSARVDSLANNDEKLIEPLETDVD
jgi:putative SOS response-associated peptidase YedK